MNVIAQDEPPPLRMQFSGEERALFHILLRGGLLQIPTFGFYRFWLTTDVRRHIWSHTEIGEDAFEYVGRARDLLMGFLIATAVLVPIYVVYTLLALEAERIVLFGSLALLSLMYGLAYFALYRARHYRASRTAFRGVRLWMSGSGWAYVGRALFWDVLTLLTIGFAYPWRAAALARYKMRHTHYGTLDGAFVATGWTFFKRAAWVWVGFLTVFFASAFMADQASVTWLRIAGALLALTASLLLPILRAIELRWWLNGLRLGPISAHSDLRIGRVFWCYARTTLWTVAIASLVSVGIGLTVLIARNVMVALGATPGDVPGLIQIPVATVGIATLAAIYLGLLLAIDIAYRLFLDRGLWAACVESVTLSNLGALQAVEASGGASPSGFGEGLLDGLDVSGGF
ncbi:MAG: DUF898 family protein [Propylenella sp.]